MQLRPTDGSAGAVATAKLLGRISLNPVRHIDPLGTAMFAITYFGSSFIFGWAKPIPVTPRNFRDPSFWNTLIYRSDMVTVQDYKVINCRPTTTT